MRRRAFLAIALTMAAGLAAWAETYGDKVKAVDPDKMTLTIPIDGSDRTFKVDDNVDVKSQMRVGKRLRVTPLKEGLKGVKVGAEVTITTEKKDAKEVVTKIVVLIPEKN